MPAIANRGIVATEMERGRRSSADHDTARACDGPEHQVAGWVDDALARYREDRDRYLQLADAVASRCRSLADEAGIPAVVQWRVKTPERVSAKLERLVRAGACAAGPAALDVVGDLAGVRVATFVETGREAMVASIRTAFRNVEIEVKDRPGSHYRATHCQVRLLPGDAPGVPKDLLGCPCEVQVCSLLAEVWNEIEHRLVYAGRCDPSAHQRAVLAALGQLTEAGDALIASLLTLATPTMQSRGGSSMRMHRAE